MTVRILMLTGYRQSGKDYLYQRLANDVSLFLKPKTWTVYKHPEANTTLKFPKFNNLKDIRFSDAIKAEVKTEYGTKSCKNIKNGRFFECLDMHFYSARDLHVTWNKLRRKQDPNYWVKVITEKLHVTNQDYMILDWHFPNEHKYLKARHNNIITARLFNSTASIPPAIIDSEHALNTWNTEYLIVPNSLNESEFHIAVKHFPFYTNYVACDHL